MTIIPMQSSDTTYQLFAVLEDENLARIREHDAAQLRLHQFAGIWRTLTLTDVWICYISPAEQPEFRRLIQNRDFPAIAKLLMAGWKYRPELGDTDHPVQVPYNQ